MYREFASLLDKNAIVFLHVLKETGHFPALLVETNEQYLLDVRQLHVSTSSHEYITLISLIQNYLKLKIFWEEFWKYATLSKIAIILTLNTNTTKY